MVNIRSYEESYNKAINDFIISIYVEEFGFEEHREEIEKHNNEIYKKSDGKLWIALNEKNEIVGTIALLKHSDDNVELKKFYVRKDYRGQGVSKALYEEVRVRMYLIVGLGNPEPEYSRTRHNMGFDVINKIAKKYDIDLGRSKFNAIFGSGIIEGQKVMLIKPQTFMNSSGESVKEYVDFYKVPLENVIVIYDDMDTDISTIRVRAKGGAGSHNGMKSMVEKLGSQNFPRVRVGVGRPDNEFDRIDYVIGQISEEEYIKLQEGEDKAADAVVYYLNNGIDNTMNIYNQ